MTSQTRATLYTYFQTNDKPTQAQFQNLIDSSLNLSDTAAQSITSSVSAFGTLDVNNNFTVKGSSLSTLTGNLSVSGVTNLSGNLSVTGSALSTLTGNVNVSGAIGIGTNAASYQLKLIQAGNNQAFFGSTGSNDSIIVIDNAAGGHSSTLQLSNGGVNKWFIASDSGNNFHLTENAVGSWITANTGAGMTLGSAQKFTIDQNNITTIQAATNGNNAFVFKNASGTQVGSVTINSSTTSFNTSSDKRLKENIAPVTNSGSLIDAMAPVTYNWKYIYGNPTGTGFLAQDLYGVFPEAVSVGDNGTVDDNGKVMAQWSVDYSKIVPLLVAEIKSLRQRVTNLGG